MKMRIKLRAFTGKGASCRLLDLPLEFEGKRAFVIWDSVMLGRYQFKTRIELDPKRVKKDRCLRGKYLYGDDLALPRPQDN